MHLRTLTLRAFRAHQESRVVLAPRLNLLHGSNGAGKTNVLEAVHYLCLAKSFLTNKDSQALRTGEPIFELEGVFEGERRPRLSVRLVYTRQGSKRIFVNESPLERLSDIVGNVPTVVFSHVDHGLTAGGPEARRRFLNNVISQSRPVYLDDLVKYRRVLRQRNELLAQGRRKGLRVSKSQKQPWNEELVHRGTRLVTARLRFVKDFGGYLQSAYRLMETATERPSMGYSPFGQFQASAAPAVIRATFEAQLNQFAKREAVLGYTMVGPHRDDLVFKIDGRPLRNYASQGQHRSFTLALKVAQYLYLHERTGEFPILLLDDVFDTLDSRRVQVFLALLQSDSVGQSLITAAQSQLLQSLVPFSAHENNLLKVRDGQVAAVP